MSISSSIALKVATVTATGLWGDLGAGEVTLWEAVDQTGLAILGIGQPPFDLAVSVDAVGLNGYLGACDDIDLAASAVGVGLHGGLGTGTMRLALDVQAGGLAESRIAFEVTVAATGLHGGVGSGTARFRAIVEAAGSSTAEQGTGSAALAVSAAGIGWLGDVGAARAHLALGASGAGVGGDVGAAVLTLELLEVTGQGWPEGIGSGSVALAITVQGDVAGMGAIGYSDARGVATGEVLVMNAVTKALTLYNAFVMNGIVEFRGQLIGSHAGGIALLEGADDDGAKIAANALTGLLGSDAQFRAPQVFVEYRSSGALDLTMKFDDADEYTYRMDETRSAGLYRNRVKAGKGAIGSRLQLGISNVDGADFSIEAIEIDLAATPRRIS